MQIFIMNNDMLLGGEHCVPHFYFANIKIPFIHKKSHQVDAA